MKNKQKFVSPEFSKRLRLLRHTKGLSQGQVAMKIGADSQRISKYERGLLYPTTELALKLVDLFDVSMDYLFRDGEAKKDFKIKNTEFVKYMQEADKLPEEKQKTLIALMDAFIKQQKLEEIMKR